MKKVNLKRIPEEQLEKERNPNYKYFDIDNKLTAVEWLENELKKIPFINPKEAFEQAKQMEKEEYDRLKSIIEDLENHLLEIGEQS